MKNAIHHYNNNNINNNNNNNNSYYYFVVKKSSPSKNKRNGKCDTELKITNNQIKVQKMIQVTLNVYPE